MKPQRVETFLTEELDDGSERTLLARAWLYPPEPAVGIMDRYVEDVAVYLEDGKEVDFDTLHPAVRESIIQSLFER